MTFFYKAKFFPFIESTFTLRLCSPYICLRMNEMVVVVNGRIFDKAFTW